MAMESRPDVIIRRPQKIDGLPLLKHEKHYRFREATDSNYMFINQLLSLTKGEWSKRSEAFRTIFGYIPKELSDGIDKLDEIRKKRNSVGHAFARDLNNVGKIELVLNDTFQGLSDAKLQDNLGLINDVATAIDKFLIENYIGAYEFIAFYVQHWGKTSLEKAESLKGGIKRDVNQFVADEANACRRLLGKDGYRPIEKKYSVDMIHYYWFEI